jgi:hypothetical protein
VSALLCEVSRKGFGAHDAVLIEPYTGQTKITKYSYRVLVTHESSTALDSCGQRTKCRSSSALVPEVGGEVLHAGIGEDNGSGCSAIVRREELFGGCYARSRGEAGEDSFGSG